MSRVVVGSAARWRGGDDARSRPLHRDGVRHRLSVWEDAAAEGVRVDSHLTPDASRGSGEGIV